MMDSSGVHSSASSSAISRAIRTWVAATASSAIEAARRHSRLVSSTYRARRRSAPISWSGRRDSSPPRCHLRLLGLLFDHRRRARSARGRAPYRSSARAHPLRGRTGPAPLRSELGLEPPDELGGLELVRIGERFPGAGEQHLEAQTGRGREPASRDQAGRCHGNLPICCTVVQPAASGSPRVQLLKVRASCPRGAFSCPRGSRARSAVYPRDDGACTTPRRPFVAVPQRRFP